MSLLSDAEARIDRCRELSGDEICVALSGGKDSLVILDLCCRRFKRVEAFHMYLVRGLRCVESQVEQAAARYGVRVTYVPHWDLSRIMKYGVLCKHVDGTEKLPLLTQKDIELCLQRKLNVTWFAYGDRASDSFCRRFYTRDNDGLRQRGIPKMYPIWNWLDANVYGYMRARKIPVPVRFGVGSEVKQSGFSLDRSCLLWVKKNYPDDWVKILEAFPFAGASVFNG